MNSKNCKDWGLLALRLAIGVIFILHGYGKLFGHNPDMTMFTGMVSRLGFPMPAFFAYAAALSEFLGGIAILLGIATRVFSVLIGIVMLVALIGVKKFAFPMGDVDFALLMIAVALFSMGPGKYSLGCMMMGKKEGEEQTCCKDGEHKH